MGDGHVFLSGQLPGSDSGRLFREKIPEKVIAACSIIDCTKIVQKQISAAITALAQINANPV